MQLVTGIEWRDGHPIAKAMGGSNRISELEISELATHGLPETDVCARNIDINLGDFKPVSFDEYAFAFNRPASDCSTHSTWSVINGKNRLVVPALVLMRALFRPGRVLMPQLFKPQSLDDVCGFSKNNGDYYVRLNRNLNKRGFTNLAPLSWFYCFPTARLAWASVYHAAKDGRLHIELPKASLKVAMRGMKVGCTIYVTHLGLLQIEALEEPAEFGAGHARQINVSTQSGKRYRNGKQAPESVPYQKLTDAEWELVAPLLIRKAANRSVLESRSLLDCVLQKLHTGHIWQEIADLNFVPVVRARTALYRWKADTRLSRIVECLNEKRGIES